MWTCDCEWRLIKFSSANFSFHIFCVNHICGHNIGTQNIIFYFLLPVISWPVISCTASVLFIKSPTKSTTIAKYLNHSRLIYRVLAIFLHRLFCHCKSHHGTLCSWPKHWIGLPSCSLKRDRWTFSNDPDIEKREREVERSGWFRVNVFSPIWCVVVSTWIESGLSAWYHNLLLFSRYTGCPNSPTPVPKLCSFFLQFFALSIIYVILLYCFTRLSRLDKRHQL